MATQTAWYILRIDTGVVQPSGDTREVERVRLNVLHAQRLEETWETLKEVLYGDEQCVRTGAPDDVQVDVARVIFDETPEASLRRVINEILELRRPGPGDDILRLQLRDLLHDNLVPYRYLLPLQEK